MNYRRIRLALRTAALALLAMLGLASIIATGGASTAPGEGGETRRFDQYPELLGIAGNGVIEAGKRARLTVVADRNQFRRNPDLTVQQTYGVDISRGSSVSVQVFDSRPSLRERPNAADFYDATVDLAASTGGAIVQRAVLTASNPRSSVSRAVFVVPAAYNYLASFTVSRTVLFTGENAEGMLELTAPAPPGGATVSLQVNSPVLTIPATVVIPAGASRARFNLAGDIASPQDYAVITAAYNGVEQQAGLWVRAADPFLLRLEIPERLAPEGATTPADVQVKAILSGPVVRGIFELRLQSNNSLVTFPDAAPAPGGGVTIPVADGAGEVTFGMQVAPLFELGVVRITAELLRDTGQGNRSINTLVADARFGTSQLAELTNVSFQQHLPSGGGISSDNCLFTWRGDYSEVTVSLSKPAPADYRLEMYASNPSVLQLSREFTVPEGLSEVRFRMDHVAGGPPETCTQVGPFCTAIGNYQRPDADLRRFTKIFVRALRTGKTLSFDRWVSYRVEPKSPFIDPFVLHSANPAGGANLAGQLGVQTDNHYDDLPIHVRLASGEEEELLWHAEYAATDRLGFSIPTPAVAATTQTSVMARSGIECIAGRGETEDDPAVTRTRSVTLSPATLLASLSVDRPVLFGGESAQLTVHLSRPAGSGGAPVALQPLFSNARVHVPTSVLVPAGADSATVTLTSDPVDASENWTIDATAEGTTRSIGITLLPEPVFVNLSATPATVTSGQTTMLRVSLDRAYPIPVTAALMSNAGAVPVPASIILTPNANGPNEASYAVTTAAVTTSTTVQLTAQVRGHIAAAFVTVLPASGGNAPPGIEYQPQNAAIASGTTASFSVVANGTPPLSYQWQRGGVNIAGATGATYTTPLSSAADDGVTFRVVVSNSAGSVTSQSAILTVGGGWRVIGGAPLIQSISADLPSLAIATDGTRYVSYVDISAGGRRVFVKRFDGSAWVTVGGSAVDAAGTLGALGNALIVGADNQPIVAWNDGARVRVARWNGTQWDIIGDDLSIDHTDRLATQDIQLARVGNDLIVAWTELVDQPSPQIRLAVKRFDAAAGGWSGAYVPNVFNATDIRLALDAQGYPAIAYVPRNDLIGGFGVGAIQAVRQSAAGWTALGGDIGPVPVVNSSGFTAIYGLGIKFDATDAPVVFGSANGTTLYAFRYAAAWQPLTGTDGVFVSLDPATELSTRMSFTRGGPQIVLAYMRQQQQAGGGLTFRTEFLQWNGAAWVPLATPLVANLESMSPALTPAGQPVIAYRNGFAISVQQFGP